MELALILWVGSLILTPLAASARGRTALGWLVWAFFLGPLALVAVLVLGKRDVPPVIVPAGPAAAGDGPAAMKACVACFLEIDRRATICGHCRTPQPVKDPRDDSAGW